MERTVFPAEPMWLAVAIFSVCVGLLLAWRAGPNFTKEQRWLIGLIAFICCFGSGVVFMLNR